MKIVGLVLLSLLGLILFLLLLVLFVPLGAEAGYHGGVFALKIKFLFLKLTLFPRKGGKKKKKEKKKSPSKKKKEENKEKTDESQPKKKKEKKLTLSIIKELLVTHFPPILSCFYISELRVRWDVHAEDAADTAVRYGIATSSMACLVAMIDRFSRRLKRAEVDIFPVYEGKSSFEGDFTLSILVGKLGWCGLRLVLDLIKYKIL